jgi:hypothetical protein
MNEVRASVFYEISVRYLDDTEGTHQTQDLQCLVEIHGDFRGGENDVI